MKSRILGAVALSLALAAPAFAADLPSRKAPAYLPPPPPPPLWTGFYVGLNAGGTWAESNSIDVVSGSLLPGNFAAAFLAGLGSGTASTGSNGGFIGGGQIGYNWQFNSNFVVGIEADIQGLTQSGNAGQSTTAGILPPSVLVSTISASKSIDYLGTVRGRLGWLFTPTLLVYGTGGLAYGGVNTSASIFQTAPVGFPLLGFGGTNAFSDTRVGWTAGGGLEWMFLPNWSAKVEYLYYDLGTVSTNGVVADAVSGLTYMGLQATPRFDGHVVRAGVNYHFNWGAPAPVVAKY
jgi:outer membrane immunogenic protein